MVFAVLFIAYVYLYASAGSLDVLRFCSDDLTTDDGVPALQPPKLRLCEIIVNFLFCSRWRCKCSLLLFSIACWLFGSAWTNGATCDSETCTCDIYIKIMIAMNGWDFFDNKKKKYRNILLKTKIYFDLSFDTYLKLWLKYLHCFFHFKKNSLGNLIDDDIGSIKGQYFDRQKIKTYSGCDGLIWVHVDNLRMLQSRPALVQISTCEIPRQSNHSDVSICDTMEVEWNEITQKKRDKM